MKYPNIEKLGLEPVHHLEMKGGFVVGCDNLEHILANATTVYGWNNRPWTTDKNSEREFTHSAKLLCVEKIKRGVTKAEIIEALKEHHMLTSDYLIKIADRIEREGIIE